MTITLDIFDDLTLEPSTQQWWNDQLDRATQPKPATSPSAIYAPSEARIAELESMPYRFYLQSPEWAETRRNALARAEQRCQRCGNRPGFLDIHHRTYERVGHEWAEDVEALCRSCHHTEHGIVAL